MNARPAPARWTLLTNHGAILVHVAQHPHSTIREVAEAVDITERATARILAQLREAGYLRAERSGRRNTYELVPELPMRHYAARGFSVAQLLSGLLSGVSVPVPSAAYGTAIDRTTATPGTAASRTGLARYGPESKANPAPGTTDPRNSVMPPTHGRVGGMGGDGVGGADNSKSEIRPNLH